MRKYFVCFIVKRKTDRPRLCCPELRRTILFDSDV